MRYFVSLLFGCLIGLVFFAPADAAISNHAIVAAHSQASSSTDVITTSGSNCPAGSMLVLSASNTLGATLSSVADSAGNTWVAPIDNIAGTGISIGISYALNTANLASGGTITATFSGSTTSAIVADCFTGIATTNASDIHNQTAQGLAATSATTVNTGTLNAASEVVIGVLAGSVAVGANSGGGSFSSGNGSPTTPFVKEFYLIVSSNVSVAFAPTWTNTANYVTDAVTFSATPITPPAVTSRPTLVDLLGAGR